MVRCTLQGPNSPSVPLCGVVVPRVGQQLRVVARACYVRLWCCVPTAHRCPSALRCCVWVCCLWPSFEGYFCCFCCFCRPHAHLPTLVPLPSMSRLSASRGGQPLGSGRQLPPQLSVGRRPLGGGGGGGGGGGIGGGVQGGANWGGVSRRGLGGGGSGRVGWGGGLREGRWGGGHRLPLPPLALPLTIPSP